MQSFITLFLRGIHISPFIRLLANKNNIFVPTLENYNKLILQ